VRWSLVRSKAQKILDETLSQGVPLTPPLPPSRIIGGKTTGLWKAAAAHGASVSTESNLQCLKVFKPISCLRDRTAVKNGTETDLLSRVDSVLFGRVIKKHFVYARVPTEKNTAEIT